MNLNLSSSCYYLQVPCQLIKTSPVPALGIAVCFQVFKNWLASHFAILNPSESRSMWIESWPFQLEACRFLFSTGGVWMNLANFQFKKSAEQCTWDWKCPIRQCAHLVLADQRALLKRKVNIIWPCLKRKFKWEFICRPACPRNSN